MLPTHIKIPLITTLLLSLLPAISTGHENNKKKQAEPIELLINFQISGQITGNDNLGAPIYTIGGPGYAPKKIFKTGEITDRIKDSRLVTELEGAQITFSGAPTDPIVNFTCLAGSCNMAFEGGSVLTSDAGVPLTGRAANLWGPVVNSPDFDPVAGIAPIRILGCGGLKEINGEGPYAGMVGSICFNGVLNFNANNSSVLTGSSKCTITLHTPVVPIP